MAVDKRSDAGNRAARAPYSAAVAASRFGGAVGVGDLVGVAGDEVVRVVDLARGLQRLVDVGRAVRVGEHAAQDRAVAQRQRRPFARDLGEVPRPPRIEENRVHDRPPVPALGADLAPDIAELQRVHALDARRAREHRHRIDDLARIDPARHRAPEHRLDMRVGIVALPRVAIDAAPRVRRHDRMVGADVLEIVIVHVLFHPRALEMKDLVVLRARQGREEEEFEDVDRQFALDGLDVAGDRFRRVGRESRGYSPPRS